MYTVFKMPKPVQLYTIREVAARTGFSMWFIYKEVAKGRIQSFRVGENERSIRIDLDGLTEYLNNHRRPITRQDSHAAANPSEAGDGEN